MQLKVRHSGRNGHICKICRIVGAYRDKKGTVHQRILPHLAPAEKFLENDIDNLVNGPLRIKGLRLEELTLQADAVEAFRRT